MWYAVKHDLKYTDTRDEKYDVKHDVKYTVNTT